MSIVKSTNRKANTIAKFYISINDSDSVEFRPTSAFAHINTKQVLKIITKATPDVTAENNQGHVNFKLAISNKEGVVRNAGFINYWENDLDDESDSSEIKEELKSLKATLRKVKLNDISLPMTAGEADNMINDL
jgi:hypothetical protein